MKQSQLAQGRIWVSALILGLAAGGCKSTNGAGTSALRDDSSTSQGSVLLVYMGGFHSCSGRPASPAHMAAYPRFAALQSAVQGQGYQVKYFLSCFDGLSSESIKWISSDNASQINSVHWDEPDSGGQIFDNVVSLSNNLSMPIFVVGHSYGGWLSSDLTGYLGTVAGGKTAVQGLYTIDPISPYHCNQARYAETVGKWSLPNILTAKRPPNSCQRSPQQYVVQDGATYPGKLVDDSDGKLRDTYILPATRTWHVYWQDKDILHSSAVDAPAGQPINTYIRFTKFFDSAHKPPHASIHTNEAVWADIQADVLAALSAAATPPGGTGDTSGSGNTGGTSGGGNTGGTSGSGDTGGTGSVDGGSGTGGTGGASLTDTTDRVLDPAPDDDVDAAADVPTLTQSQTTQLETLIDQGADGSTVPDDAALPAQVEPAFDAIFPN